MKTWKFTYWFEDSDWFEWEAEITPEEEAIINEAIAQGKLLNEVTALEGLLQRVYNEIEESYADEFSSCEGLTVNFQDPNEPFYNIK